MSWQSCELELDSVDFFAMQGGGVRAYREYVRRRQRSSAKKDTLAKLRFNLVKTLAIQAGKTYACFHIFVSGLCKANPAACPIGQFGF